MLWRQHVAITRRLMTFLVTDEITRRFNEAEAVLIADPTNRAFGAHRRNRDLPVQRSNR